MRFFISLLMLSALACIGNSEVDEEYHEIVDNAIQKATHEYERALYNATVYEQQYSTRRRATKSTPETEEIGKMSHIQKRAVEILTDVHGVERNTALRQIRQALPAACQQAALNCNFNSKYRTQEGSCNNRNNPRWGSAPIPLVRVAAPAYDDGVDVPRGGRQTSRLPNPRLISTAIHPDSNTPNTFITNMVPQFGQFFDHDISLTPEANRQCCAGQSSDPDCWPITIPTNDVFFSRFGQRCMSFTRSTPWCFASTTGRREQINVNTAYIDASQVYGSSATRTRAIRAFSGGRLITNTNGLNGFLPTGPQLGIQVQGTFLAGDDRINENPALAVMQNLFLMEHNRIATELQRLMPGWSDEILFQETRRIVGAEMQQVAYNEYLPIILGSQTMNEYSLWLGNGYSTYNPSVDASVINSFATAAYRFGHSLINGLVRLVSNSNTAVGSFNIADNYFVSTPMTQSNGQGYDWILRGLMTQNSQEFDPFVTDGVTNFLFKPANANFGSDLVARNIQRGRDHGLPSYNTFRSICGLPRITGWNARPAEVRADAFSRLSSLFQTPEDIDFFTGGLIELPVQGGITGPTFNCIKATQFARLKFGDRFFFTHSSQTGTFNTAQLTELRRRTLGDIICQNSQQPSTLQNVFLVQSSSNSFISCTDTRRRLNIGLFTQ